MGELMLDLSALSSAADRPATSALIAL